MSDWLKRYAPSELKSVAVALFFFALPLSAIAASMMQSAFGFLGTQDAIPGPLRESCQAIAASISVQSLSALEWLFMWLLLVLVFCVRRILHRLVDTLRILKVLRRADVKRFEKNASPR